jgi:hypothetical protein
MAPCEKPEHVAALLPPALPRMPMPAKSSAPDPIVTEDGLDSERHMRTLRAATMYTCPACGFRCGAEYEPPRPTGLPPELRDEAAWKQEARAHEAAKKAAHIKAIARREYDAHPCAAQPSSR